MNRKEFKCDFSGTVDGWVVDPATDYATADSLIVRTDRDAVKNVWLTIEPSTVYTVETRLKISGYGRENGLKLERSDVRLMVYLRDGHINCVGANGSYSAKVPKLNDFNTYKFTVIGNRALVYINGEFQFVYELGTWRSDSDRLTVFMRARCDGVETCTEIDYINYIAHDTTVSLVSPADKMTAVRGETVTLKARVEDESIPYVDFYANGTFLGRADAGDYTLDWHNVPAGSYAVGARYGDHEAVTAQLTVSDSVDGTSGGVRVSNAAPTVGETVTLSLAKTADDAREVVYYVNGKPVGEQFTVDFTGKAVAYAKICYSDGSYSYTSESAIVSTARGTCGFKLQKNYIITYTAENGTSVKASDGVYALDIRHTDGGVGYTGADGEAVYRLGGGAYRLHIDSGVCDVYYNGQFAFSFRMPITDADNGIESNAADLIVTGCSADRHTLTPDGGEVHMLPDFTNEYALEFTLSSPRELFITLNDGTYLVDIWSSDGKLIGKNYPNGVAGVIEEEVLCTIPEGKHAYRLTVSNGIAQLFINNLWAYSLRLPVDRGVRCARLGGIDTLTVRETNDLYVFEDSFDGRCELPSEVYYETEAGVAAEFTDGAMVLTPADTDCERVLAKSGDYVEKSYTATLKAYAYDTAVAATLRVDSADKGGIWLTARYINHLRHVRAGYSFDDGAWEIVVVDHTAKVIASNKAEFPLASDAELVLKLNGDNLTLTVNGVTAVESGDAALRFYGQVGIRAEEITARVSRFAYTGTGRPCPGADTFMNGAGSPEIFEYAPGNIFMVSSPRNMYESTDDGHTFRRAERDGFYNNTIRLDSGAIVSTHRESVGDGYVDYARVSTDNGATFEGPFPIQDYVINRITMNNKLTQTSDGRLFLASGESGDGVEGEGGIRVFYSDDEGRTWAGASILSFDGSIISGGNEARMDVHTTNVNCQESKIAEMPDGTLRLYVRTDEGFLYYSVSTDRGETWSAQMYTSEFITVLSAYNIERDRYTGDYYMAWEYNAKNDSTTIQFPRTRVALAVSRDNMRSWEYVADIDEMANFNTFGHMNIGLMPTKTAVYVDAVRYVPDGSGKAPGCNYAVRIDKRTMKTTARFTKVHVVASHGGSIIMDEARATMLLVSPDGSRVITDKRIADIAAPMAGYVPVSIAASSIGASAECVGGKAVLRIAESEAVFADGSDIVRVDSVEKRMTSPAALTDSGLLIPVTALADIFGRTVKTASDGTIVSVFDRYGLADIDEIAGYAPWKS